MPEIIATVVKTEDGLKLQASRQSTCSHCKATDACSMQWEVGSSELSFKVDSEQLLPGQKIVLSCSERKLLTYLAILFLPALLWMLALALIPLGNQVHPILVFTVKGALPIGLGAVVSHQMLKVRELSLTESEQTNL